MSQSKVAPGAGVPKTKTVPKPEEPKNQEDRKPYDVKVNADGSPIWVKEPTIADQFITLNHTCKEQDPRCSIFELPKDLDRYNELLAETCPQEAPRSLIYTEEKQFYEGKWLILVKHATVLYKKLIPPTEKNIEKDEEDG